MLYGLKFSTGSFWDEYPVMRVLLRVGDSFSKLVTASVFVLIVTVIISVMFLLKSLGEKMDLLNLNLIGAEIKLIQWKKQHLLVTQFVDRINDCFGGIIFLIVFHGFVCLIYYFNSIFHSTTHGGDIVWNILTICMLISKLFRLTLIIYVCYLMQYQVIDINKEGMFLKKILLKCLEAIFHNRVLNWRKKWFDSTLHAMKKCIYRLFLI